MKRFLKIFTVLIVLFLSFFSAEALRRHPLVLFVLRGDETLEAFRLQVGLGHSESTIEALKLTSEQKKRGLDALKDQNLEILRGFSKEFGKFDIVAGEMGDKMEDPWPPYIGGGWGSIFRSSPSAYFDDAAWLDRTYLALVTKAPPTPPFVPAEIHLDGMLGSKPVTPSVTAGPVTAATAIPRQATATVVRLEILNGCGITGAADWVARRIKGLSVVVVSTGNADRFNYPKTILKSSIGIPIALEDLLTRLGLPKDSLEETIASPTTVDATLIIGKDFYKLKERARDRRHH